MDNSLLETLRIGLIRTLEIDPNVTLEEAVNSVIARTPEIESLRMKEEAVRGELMAYTHGLRRFGVPNPRWLSTRDMEFHFFLVNSQPGWLQNLARQVQSLAGSVSHYILYGIWDSLLIFSGSPSEAAQFRNVIQSTTYYELSYFQAAQTILYHRYRPAPPEAVEVDEDILNRLIIHYDELATGDERKRLERGKVLLGSLWRPLSGTYPGVVAYVGITMHGGGHEVSGDELLQILQRQEELATTITHLWQVDRGYPFHYFARLNCRTLSELDQSTDQIGASRIGHVSLEPTTFVVARGSHALPTVRKITQPVEFAPTIDLRSVVEVASRVFGELGSDAAREYNQLEPSVQLLLLQSVAELREEADKGALDNRAERRIRNAITSFAREALQTGKEASLVGAVAEATTLVEERVRDVVATAIGKAYRNDKRSAQNELQLPKRDVRQLALGQVARALSTMRTSDRFGFLSPVLTEEHVKRVEEFAENHRNQWLHGKTGNLPFSMRVHRARVAVIDAIQILAWLDDLAQSIPSDTAPDVLMIKPRTGRKEAGVFVSHSHKDNHVARRIAEALRALEYRVFYDEWSIGFGESILGKIQEGLAQHDTLVVLLSRSSVRSEWVQRELNSSLMAQLSGQQIDIIPVLIEECELPPIIADLRYLDMRDDFERGFIALLDFLSGKRE